MIDQEEEERHLATPYDLDVPPEEQKSKALATVERFAALQVVDQPTLTDANNGLLFIREVRRRLDEEFDPQIEQANYLHKSLVKQKRKWTDPLEFAERALKPKIAAYLAEQDRKIYEAERAAARAKAKAAVEADEVSDRAHELIREGRIDEADAVVAEGQKRVEETYQAAVAVIPEKPVAEGAVLRDAWKYEVENEAMVPREFLIVDEKKIRRYITALKHQAAIPGVRIWVEKTLAVRDAK